MTTESLKIEKGYRCSLTIERCKINPDEFWICINGLWSGCSITGYGSFENAKITAREKLLGYVGKTEGEELKGFEWLLGMLDNEKQLKLF